MNKNPKYQHLTQYKWIKGQSGNLQGRPKSHLVLLKELGYTKPLIAAMLAEMLFMPYEEVHQIYENRSEIAIKRIIATAIVKSGGYSGHYNKHLAGLMNILFECALPYQSKEPLELDKPEEL